MRGSKLHAGFDVQAEILLRKAHLANASRETWIDGSDDIQRISKSFVDVLGIQKVLIKFLNPAPCNFRVCHTSSMTCHNAVCKVYFSNV